MAERLCFANRVINWAFLTSNCDGSDDAGVLRRLVRKLVGFIFHVELPVLRHPLVLGHPYGIVVNGSAVLGEGVRLHQGVTIGSKRSGKGAGIPKIGARVVIYPNAVVFGGIEVGDDAVIGAGAVVFCDVPPDAMAVGNPARIIESADWVRAGFTDPAMNGTGS